MHEDAQQAVENAGRKLSFSERLFGLPTEESLMMMYTQRR